MNSLWKIAWRVFFRDLQRGELNTLIGSLIVAVAGISATGFLSDRLERTMDEGAAMILGGDLAIRGRSELAPDWKTEALQLGLTVIENVEFSSMLVDTENMVLAGVKAVEPGYPLRGDIITQDAPSLPPTIRHEIPERGEVWVDADVLERLSLKIGDSVSIGDSVFKVTHIVIREPDSRSDFSSLSPRVLMNRRDLAATHVIRPGSQLTFATLMTGNPEHLNQFKSLIQPHLRADQKVTGLDDDRPELGKIIQRTRQFLSFFSLAILLMSAVAIALASSDYIRRHSEFIALLRCLGTGNVSISWILWVQLSGIGLLGSLIGILGGAVIEVMMLHGLKILLPAHAETHALHSTVFALVAGNMLLFTLVLPAIIDLRNRSSLGIFQNTPDEPQKRRSSIYLLGLILLTTVLYWHARDTQLIGSTLGMTLGLMLILTLGASVILKVLRQIGLKIPSLQIRLGIRRLYRHPRRTLIQLAGFGLTFGALSLVTHLRYDLIDDWMAHLPESAPNYFVINLFDNDLAPFRELLEQHAPQPLELYPVVRGRLVKINGEAAMDRARKDKRAEGALNRDLALTYAEHLPSDNSVVEGRWNPDSGAGDVSIEEGLARRLDVHLGDRLEFDFLGVTLAANVRSIRSVHWDRMTPNFFFIFSEGTLEQFPRTWMTSLHIDDTQFTLKRALINRFPSLTLIEIGRLVDQIHRVVEGIGASVLPLLALCLAAGICVLITGLFATRQDRLNEDRLLRVLGASARTTRQMQLTEFLVLGSLSGAFGASIAEALRWGLYRHVLEIPFSFQAGHFVVLPLSGAIAMSLAGLWASGLNRQTL